MEIANKELTALPGLTNDVLLLVFSTAWSGGEVVSDKESSVNNGCVDVNNYDSDNRETDAGLCWEAVHS